LSRSVQINMSTRNERPIRHRAGGQSWREPMVEVALDTWRKVEKWLAEKAAADKAAADKAAADNAWDDPWDDVEVLDEDTQLALSLSLSEAEFRQGVGRQGGGRGGGHRADLPRRPPVVALDAFVEYEA